MDIAAAIDDIVLNAGFKEIKVEKLQDMNTRAKLIKRRILDYRARKAKDESVMFGGLNFNSDDISVQTYVIKNTQNSIVGNFTFVLIPKGCANEAKYIIRDDKEEKLHVGNFLSLGCTDKLPDFIFEPGFIMVLPRYRKLCSRSTIKMINVYEKIYQTISRYCPPNTWIEVRAEGALGGNRLNVLKSKVNKAEIGEDIPYSELGFNIKNYDFSKNTKESDITVWMSEKKLKLTRINGNIIRLPATGPIFVGKLK